MGRDARFHNMGEVAPGVPEMVRVHKLLSEQLIMCVILLIVIVKKGRCIPASPFYSNSL
jgi:hypothetical protein